MSQNGSEPIASSEPKKSSGEEYEETENAQNNNNIPESQNINNEEKKEQQKENEQVKSENNNANEGLESQTNPQVDNNYNYEQNKKEIMEKIEIRKQQADLVDKYIHETGIGISFQIIFSELISKKIPVENYYTYTASRLRQIGREKEAMDRKNNKNK